MSGHMTRSRPQLLFSASQSSWCSSVTPSKPLRVGETGRDGEAGGVGGGALVRRGKVSAGGPWTLNRLCGQTLTATSADQCPGCPVRSQMEGKGLCLRDLG